MKLLFIGDIVGKPGRETVKKLLPQLKQEYMPDIIAANGENSAGGMGINEKKYKELIEYGIDVVTLGNHVWHNRDFAKEISKCEKLVRPANYPPGVPGTGMVIVKGVAFINLLGRVFMKELDCPFRSAEALLNELNGKAKAVVVDFHAEATSEKIALGWFLDGRVSAVIGTHTHVQTADERVLPQGTAYITDAGMVGPSDSVIGVGIAPIIERFVTQMPSRFDVVDKGPCILNAVLIDIDETTGRARKIERIVKQFDYQGK